MTLVMIFGGIVLAAIGGKAEGGLGMLFLLGGVGMAAYGLALFFGFA